MQVLLLRTFHNECPSTIQQVRREQAHRLGAKMIHAYFVALCWKSSEILTLVCGKTTLSRALQQSVLCFRRNMNPILEGFPRFAEFIARDGDAAVYRKFQNLSARNLLYQQSELNDLERQMHELDIDDAKDVGNEDAQKAARYWDVYARDEKQGAELRRNLQQTIKVKIKEYRKKDIDSLVS